MEQQTQPALAPGQVWRSPCGNRTRTVEEVNRDYNGGPVVVDVAYHTASGKRNVMFERPFRRMCDGWTLDAPKEPTPCN